MVEGGGIRVEGSGFRVQGSGMRVEGSGFRVQGLGVRVDIAGPATPPLKTPNFKLPAFLELKNTDPSPLSQYIHSVDFSGFVPH